MPVELEIVSPEKLLLSRPVEMVVLPAYEGEMGVLQGHSPMIVLLRGGMIRLYEGGQVKEQLYVSGGFAEVTPERVTVLATEATPAADVSRAEGEKRLAAAEADYAAADKSDVVLLDAAMDRIQSARAMVEAAAA
ncbi:MAG: ATP synthase F1 subunit epsilon [Alphaproteobacteria bacterium]|nr:ATP synthase F1 subunit epsilon [Alphaproteobacteria bacterium]